MLLVAAACAKAGDVRADAHPVVRADPRLEGTAELLAGEQAERAERTTRLGDFTEPLRAQLRESVAAGCDNGDGE
jgi:hypothetical protein